MKMGANKLSKRNRTKILRLYDESVEVLNRHCKGADKCETCKYLISIDGDIRCEETDYFAQHNIMIYIDKECKRHILTLTDEEKITVRNLYKYCAKVDDCDTCKRYGGILQNDDLRIFGNSCGVWRILHGRRIRNKENK